MMIVELSARFTVEFMFNHHHPTCGILTGSLHISPARERWETKCTRCLAAERRHSVNLANDWCRRSAAYRRTASSSQRSRAGRTKWRRSAAHAWAFSLHSRTPAFNSRHGRIARVGWSLHLATESAQFVRNLTQYVSARGRTNWRSRSSRARVQSIHVSRG